jgi:hypothetical protein
MRGRFYHLDCKPAIHHLTLTELAELIQQVERLAVFLQWEAREARNGGGLGDVE